MICIVHGYGLSGSGSNLWTRDAIEALCRIGETVHLVCQERHPEAYAFVAEAHAYGRDGGCEQLFSREVPHRGACVLHRSQLDVLPVYVGPPSDSTSMVRVPDMTEEAIEGYLARNESTLKSVFAENDVHAVLVNHVVLMSVAVRRACLAAGVPYAVFPHGSAIEYVVRQDERVRRLALRALKDATAILVQSHEMERRVSSVFPELEEVSEKMQPVALAVDTDQFGLVPSEERSATIAELGALLADRDRGCFETFDEAVASLPSGPSLEEMHRWVSETDDSSSCCSGEGPEERLDRIDWERDDIVVFVGRLIRHKGIASLVAAFPAVLSQRPHARLVIAGRGPSRRPMKAFLAALSTGNRSLARRIAEWGRDLDGEEEGGPFEHVVSYFDRLDAKGELDHYFEDAERLLTADHVVFTGYLEHNLLSRLLACSDVIVIPSVVTEAGPLVFLEALASGCFPVGTNIGGLADKIQVASRHLPEAVAERMKLRPEPEHTVADIVRNVGDALELDARYRETLREIAMQHYDWASAARRLVEQLDAMRHQPS